MSSVTPQVGVSAAIRRALGILCEPGGVYELRAPKAGKRGTISGYYSDLDRLAHDAARTDAESVAPGLYFTINPVDPALLARAADRYRERAEATTNDTQILRRAWLPIDIDALRPSGISSADSEHAAALAFLCELRMWLHERGVPMEAMIIVDSGNGGHLYVRIDLPAEDHGLCARILKALDAIHSTAIVAVDTTTANAARIMRIPGTMARKGDSTLERPHRRSGVLETPEHVVVTPLEVLEGLAALVPEEAKPRPGTSALRKRGMFDVDEWLARYDIEVTRSLSWQGGQRWVLAQCPMSDAHSDGAYVVQHASGAISAGCHHKSCTWRWADLRARYEPRERRSAGGEDSESTEDILTACGFSALTTDSKPEAFESAVRDLACRVWELDPVARCSLRSSAVKQLKDVGVQGAAALVDAALSTVRDESGGGDVQGSALQLDDPEPAEASVDGAALLTTIGQIFERHVVLPAGASVVLALWVLHTFVIEAAWYAPILALISPTKRCGKTTVLDLLGALVRRPLTSAHITPAALFRVIEAAKPTLLIDEADAWARTNEELRGLLNAGHSRSAKVIRTVGEKLEPRAFAVFGPKAIAAIGKLPGTIMDRSIVVQMRRRASTETLEPLRRDRLGETLKPLQCKAMRWALDHVGELKKADPVIPTGLGDRAADNWRPLLAIADRAGEGWPERSREAAALLSLDNDRESEVGVMLLEDLHTIFAEVDILTSETVAERLVGMEGRPWPEWGKLGRPITATAVAKLLKPFKVAPEQIWNDGRNVRGYRRSAFLDAWERYLESSQSQAATTTCSGEVWEC